MRMEQDGLLTPAYINEETGYRYYNIWNVLRVLRNLSLKDCGVTQKELAEYYSGEEEYGKLLEILEKKQQALRDMIAMLKVQTNKELHLHTATFDFTATYCYVKKLTNVTDNSLLREVMWQTVGEAISNGYCLRREMHAFTSMDATGYLQGDSTDPSEYTINIPILPPKDAKHLPENIVYYPDCHTISTLLYGGTEDIAEAFSLISEQIKFRDFVPNGDARIISIVSSFPGGDVPKKDWVARVCVPIVPVTKTYDIESAEKL